MKPSFNTEKGIVKVKEKKLDNMLIKGNYLYNENGTYYFNDVLRNCLIYVDPKYYKDGNKNGNLFLEVEKYLLDFFSICSKSKNKPSIVYYNSITTADDISKRLGASYLDILDEEDILKINEGPAFCCLYKNFSSIMETVIKSRTDMPAPRNDVFVIVDKPEKELIKELNTFVTIGRSRNVYFIVFVHDKELYEKTYSQEDFNILSGNCALTFICSPDEVVEVNRYIPGLYGYLTGKVK